MEVDDDVEDDDMDCNPSRMEGSPSETSSSLTSEAECEETSFKNQPSTEVYLHGSPDNKNTGDSVLPQKRISADGMCEENVPESTSTQLYCENGEGHANGSGNEPLQIKASFSQSVPSSHHLLVEASEEDAVARRTRARTRYSLAAYALKELETFLQESDDEGNLQNVDEEEEYRKFLAAVLSGGGDDRQACQGDETQGEDENDADYENVNGKNEKDAHRPRTRKKRPKLSRAVQQHESILSGGGDDTQAGQGDETQDEDENDADFELEIEESLESNGDKNVENYEKVNGRNKKDARRPRTRKKRPKLSRAVHRHESTKSNVRPILPNSSSVLLAPRNSSHNINVPSSSSSVNGPAVVEGFTDEQLGRLYMMIYEHAQLMIQTFSLSVLDPSKQCVAADVKKMIVELVGYRDKALARRNTVHRPFCFEKQHLQSALHASFESSQCQWIPSIRNPVMSILDVSPLHLALNYLSDVAASVVKHRKSLVDGTAEKIRSRKEPLFALPVLSTGKDAKNVSQDRSNNVSAASSASPGELHPKKTSAATLVESTKTETVALVPFDIARLAQRFYPLFNFLLFPRKPPPAAVAHRVLFTDAEEGLLALGILEYNSDWDAIQKRFLPCKSTHQIYVRQKNRCSSSAPDNPVKEVHRIKTSPLSTEEIQRVEEGLKIFKNDWTSVWKFVLPYRDPAQLQRQWKVATGVQRSYSKSDALKEKRRTYEAKRKKLKASMPDSRGDRGKEDDNDASEGVENDDNLYVSEAYLADRENRSVNTMQTGTSPDYECGAEHGCFEQHSRNSLKHGVSASCSYASDGLSSKRVFGGTMDELQASQFGKEKGSHVVKLAPDLPAINLPPSVRVISQEFHQNAAHFNCTSDNAVNDMFPVPPPTFTECVYTELNLLPDCSASDRLQHGTSNGSVIEDGAEQDFLMHPLLFQDPPQVLLSYSHLGENLTSHSRNCNFFPFEKSNKQATNGMEGASVNFHPLLQRTEAEMHGEVPEEDCHQFANQCLRDSPVHDQSAGREAFTSPCERENSTDLQASTSPCERGNNIDLDSHLCSLMDFRNAKNFISTISKSSTQLDGFMKGRASISNLEPGNACSHDDIEEASEEAMEGTVMEQEELSDSEADSQHVEFECEEIEDSEDEQVKDAELCLTENKGTSVSVVCSEIHESNDQCQIQQGLEQVVKQGASLTHKSHGSSSTRSGRAKLKPEHAKRTGTRRSERLAKRT